MELSSQLKGIQTGHGCLVICCIFYLIWWSITFNPMREFPVLPKYILFICIAVSGISGLFFLIRTIGNLPAVNRSISSTAIALSGVAVYIILLFLTGHYLFKIPEAHPQQNDIKYQEIFKKILTQKFRLCYTTYR